MPAGWGGSDLKTYLKMRGQVPDAVSLVRHTVVKLLDFLYSGIQLYVLIFVLSHFYILICMYLEMIHR